MRRNSLAIAITLVFAQPAFAADPAASSTPRKLQSVVVVASRVEQPVRRDCRLGRADRARARWKHRPDPRHPRSRALRRQPQRQRGRQPLRVRLRDPRARKAVRVAVELDGVPLGDGFSVGSFSRAGRNLVDPELLERVEFLRGPASSLYGSDALAGVVAMRTRDPGDLLAEGSGDVFVGSRITHDFARRLDRGERFDRDRARRLADAAEREPAPGARARQPAAQRRPAIEPGRGRRTLRAGQTAA